MKALSQAEFERREYRQLRAVRRYAKSNGLELEPALIKWITSGLAEQWAEQN